MDRHAYTERIGYSGTLEPELDCLRAIHRAHMFRVPFENLDIPLGIPIELELSRIYDKVVVRRRGGFCYELNGLFGWLLQEIGFVTELLSARVYSDGEPGPEFDHMCLLVGLDPPLLADVGFGDSFIEPLPLDSDAEWLQHGALYRLQSAGPQYRVLEQRRPNDRWRPQYVLCRTPRQLSDFAEMCAYQQRSPTSPFTQKTVCSRATPNGRTTLTHDRLIVTRNAERNERTIPTATDYRAALKCEFGIDLGGTAGIHKLMRRAQS